MYPDQIERYAHENGMTIPEAIEQITFLMIYSPKKAKGPLPEGPIENNCYDSF